jgi:hypothetical protein
LLIQASPEEKLSSGIQSLIDVQSGSQPLQYDCLPSTPHNPLVLGALMQLTYPVNTSDIAYERIWDWWVKLGEDRLASGKYRTNIFPNGTIENLKLE